MFQIYIDNLGVLAGFFRVYEVTQACQILP